MKAAALIKNFVVQIFLIIPVTALAQTGNIPKGNKTFVNGRLEDKLLHQPVPGATVSVINQTDSSLMAFTRTDSLGQFSFSGLLPGLYRLSASHISFHPQWKSFEFRLSDTAVKLDVVLMVDKNVLEEVTLVAQRPPVELNGDTLEFNAESFKTKPNAVVEDLLKKMPGIEVDKDGTIRVNGKQISRVLVNGKDFFTGDPKIASRNLPADAIDKVQVFDKQSDQAAFTGIDDGNAEKTINLKLKKNKENAAFGKMNAESGTAGRYDAQGNINKFKGNRQLSMIGMANNTNRQGFGIMDILNFTGQSKKMLGGGGGMVISTAEPEDFGLPVSGITNNQGVVTTIAAGVNYSDTWKKNTGVNASYFYNNLMPENTRIVNRQNILPGNDFTWKQYSISNSQTESNRFNFSADHQIDSFNTVKFTLVTGYQKGKAGTNSDYESFTRGGKILNSGFTNVTSSTEAYNTSNTFLYRHKFKKKSRTFSLNASMQYNDSHSNGTQGSVDNFFITGSPALHDTLNQVGKLNGVTQSYGVNVSYTEPLSKRSLLELRTFYNTSRGDLDRNTFDFDYASGKHDLRNNRLSSAFGSSYDYGGTGISMRVQKKKLGYTIGSNLQYAELTGRLRDSAFIIKQHFTNFLPVATFNYNFTKVKSLRLNYNSSTLQPITSQLQPVKDISDPLNVREGNPRLKQSYNNNIGLEYFNANPGKQNNLFAFINYFAAQNAIVNSDVIDATGTRTTRPVNADGVYYVIATADKGFRVKKINTRFTVGGNIAFNHLVNFVNDQKNTTASLSVAPLISANYTYRETVDVNISARLSYNRQRYSLQHAFDNDFRRQTYELDATVNLGAGFIISNEFNYSVFSGRSAGFNKNIARWNATVSKQLLKSKKGMITISGYDLLKQNVGVERNANSNFVEDVQYKTLQRYFTVGLTYSLQKPSAGGPRAMIRTL